LPSTPDYFVAPFAPDGELIGVAGRALAELSPKWLDFCHELLASNGAAFRCPIPLPPLQHITLQVTAGSGTALVSLLVNDQPASSAVALTGRDPAAEAEVLKMFVDSIRRVPLVQQAATTSKPFESLFALAERPVYAVVLWANPRISTEDQELVQELENHLAAALTARPPAV
jgi:hypothetical protein